MRLHEKIDQMRTTKRQADEMVRRLEAREKKNKTISLGKYIVSAIIIALIVVPLKSDDPNIVHGIVTWCAIVAYFGLSLLTWRQLAPMTRLRRAKSAAVGAGIALALMPLILMLFNPTTEERWHLYLLLWGGAVALGVLYLWLRHRTARLRTETDEEVQRIRRREQRRKRMELL